MPSKLATPVGGPGQPARAPSAQEALLFYHIVTNIRGKPDVDWEAVATAMGFKNSDTAKVSNPIMDNLTMNNLITIHSNDGYPSHSHEHSNPAQFSCIEVN
jgi:hypothetical protein